MALPRWHSDRPLDAEIVRDVVNAQFPELAASTIAYLHEGWDSQAFEVNGTWIFRFPKRADVVPWLERELALLPLVERLAPSLPVPHMDLVGKPHPQFPYQFSGYRKLEGVGGIFQPTRTLDRPALAKQLGQFLSEVHRIDVPAEALRWPDGPNDSRAIAYMARRTAERLPLLTDHIDPVVYARALALLNDLASLPAEFAGEPRFIHNDLHPEHVLVDPAIGKVSGIIDWGDLGAGDPAIDFPGLQLWLGDAFVDEVLVHYTGPTDVGFRGRVRFRALCFGILDASYGVLRGKIEDVRSELPYLHAALETYETMYLKRSLGSPL